MSQTSSSDNPVKEKKPDVSNGLNSVQQPTGKNEEKKEAKQQHGVRTQFRKPINTSHILTNQEITEEILARAERKRQYFPDGVDILVAMKSPNELRLPNFEKELPAPPPPKIVKVRDKNKVTLDANELLSILQDGAETHYIEKPKPKPTRFPKTFTIDPELEKSLAMKQLMEFSKKRGRPKREPETNNNNRQGGGRSEKEEKTQKPKKREVKKANNRELQNLLQDEGAVNMLYSVEKGETETKERLLSTKKRLKKVLKKKAEVEEALLGSAANTGSSGVLLRHSRQDKLRKASVDSQDSEHSVTHDFNFQAPAEASKIIRRHSSSSSYSSRGSSPRRLSIDLEKSPVPEPVPIKEEQTSPSKPKMSQRAEKLIEMKCKELNLQPEHSDLIKQLVQEKKNGLRERLQSEFSNKFKAAIGSAVKSDTTPTKSSPNSKLLLTAPLAVLPKLSLPLQKTAPMKISVTPPSPTSAATTTIVSTTSEPTLPSYAAVPVQTSTSVYTSTPLPLLTPATASTPTQSPTLPIASSSPTAPPQKPAWKVVEEDWETMEEECDIDGDLQCLPPPQPETPPLPSEDVKPGIHEIIKEGLACVMKPGSTSKEGTEVNETPSTSISPSRIPVASSLQFRKIYSLQLSQNFSKTLMSESNSEGKSHHDTNFTENSLYDSSNESESEILQNVENSSQVQQQQQPVEKAKKIFLVNSVPMMRPSDLKIELVPADSGSEQSSNKSTEPERNPNEGQTNVTPLIPEEKLFSGINVRLEKIDSITKVNISPSSTFMSMSISARILIELSQAFDYLNQEHSKTKAIVLNWNPTNGIFSNGIDLFSLISDELDLRKKYASQMALALRDAVCKMSMVGRPIVTSVSGKAIGLGVVLLTYCDYVLADDSATFYTPYAKLGYLPEAGATLTLPHVIGHRQSTNLLLGCSQLDSREAEQCGLVSKVVPTYEVEPRLMEVALNLANQSLPSMVSTKALLMHTIRTKLPSLLNMEVVLLEQHWTSDDCQERIRDLENNPIF